MPVALWGRCPATDPYGQLCELLLEHKGPHRPPPLAQMLENTTDDVVVRTYSGKSAEVQFQNEAEVFKRFDFYPVAQSAATNIKAPSMGQIFVLGGYAASRLSSSSITTVTFRRERPAAAGTSKPEASIPEQIRALGELREAGLLTDAEFESKKRDLLGRM